MPRTTTEITERIDAILALPDEDCEINYTFREILMGEGDATQKDITCTFDIGLELLELVAELRTHYIATDVLTQYAIAMSLCPLHFRDWAICFDDADPECDQIRTIYPHSHDT